MTLAVHPSSLFTSIASHVGLTFAILLLAMEMRLRTVSIRYVTAGLFSTGKPFLLYELSPPSLMNCKLDTHMNQLQPGPGQLSREWDRKENRWRRPRCQDNCVKQTILKGLCLGVIDRAAQSSLKLTQSRCVPKTANAR